MNRRLAGAVPVMWRHISFVFGSTPWQGSVMPEQLIRCILPVPHRIVRWDPQPRRSTTGSWFTGAPSSGRACPHAWPGAESMSLKPMPEVIDL